VTVLTRMLHAIDGRDWPAVRAGFTDEVRTDYTSLFGGSPETISADDLVARWRGLIPGFTATQHITGPVVATDDRLETHVIAHHWLDGDTWVVYGHYVARTVDGRIAELTLQTFHETGDRDILAAATERAASAS
jgi:SnoaL-like protein